MKSTVYLHFSEFWRNDQIQHDYGTVRNRLPKYGQILPCTDCITHYYARTLETLEYQGGYREAQSGNETKVDSSLEALWKKRFSPMLILSIIDYILLRCFAPTMEWQWEFKCVLKFHDLRSFHTKKNPEQGRGSYQSPTD